MNENTEQTYRHRVLRVLLHIQQHLDADLRLEDLARVAHFSPYHFHRIFRAMVGESVAAHVRRLRLERSAGRLLQSERTILDIGLEAGFDSHEAFTRAFRAMFGCTQSVPQRDGPDPMERDRAGRWCGVSKLPPTDRRLGNGRKHR